MQFVTFKVIRRVSLRVRIEEERVLRGGKERCSCKGEWAEY